MKTTIVKCEFVKQQPLALGTYYGIWSGYGVEIIVAEGAWRLKTTVGIRGTCKCKITVDESGTSIESEK